MMAIRMYYDPEKRRRRSTRLPGYDYAQPGAYFVTLCVQQRECLLGEIESAGMACNEAGAMIEMWWRELPRKFPACSGDAFVVMPNHMHGIIVIDELAGADARHKDAHTSASLPRIVQWFKTMTTNAYIRGVDERGWMPFARRLWQRNYYEHIVRDEIDLNRIREYILNNPLNWEDDPDNPAVDK